MSELFRSIFSAAPSFSDAIIVALLALCGVLYSQIAPRQKNTNDALALFLGELQKDRAQHIAHASSLASQLATTLDQLTQVRGRIEQLEGEVRQRDQIIAGLRAQVAKDKSNDTSGK